MKTSDGTQHLSKIISAHCMLQQRRQPMCGKTAITWDAVKKGTSESDSSQPPAPLHSYQVSAPRCRAASATTTGDLWPAPCRRVAPTDRRLCARQARFQGAFSRTPAQYGCPSVGQAPLPLPAQRGVSPAARGKHQVATNNNNQKPLTYSK